MKNNRKNRKKLKMLTRKIGRLLETMIPVSKTYIHKGKVRSGRYIAQLDFLLKSKVEFIEVPIIIQSNEKQQEE